MGSFNFPADQKSFHHSYSYKSTPNYKYPSHSSLREIGPDRTIDTGDQRVLLLINSAYYFLECVYILYNKGYYRLVVLHNNRLLTYRNYRTLKGAKIAFQKIYQNKAWKEGVKARWTPSVGGKGNCDLVKEKVGIEPNKPLKAYSI